MKYTFSPQTFFVSEVYNPQIKKEGAWYYYILEKKGISHKQLEKRLPCKAFFCGKKDKNATATQWFCSRDFMEDLDEEDLKVRFKGCANERIHIGVHKGNRFSVFVQLEEGDDAALKKFNPKKELMCNYFGNQRFDGRVTEFWALLAQQKFEEALKLFLCEKSEYDSEKSTAMKKLISTKWGKWKEIAQDELIALTKKKELFLFLDEKMGAELDKEKVFENAFIYAERRSLKQMLKACQSMRFNEELNKVALMKRPNNVFGEINGKRVALSASKAFPRYVEVKATPFEEKLACLGFERKTFFDVGRFKAKKMPGKMKAEISFELARGAYATVFLKFLDARLRQNQNSDSKKVKNL